MVKLYADKDIQKCKSLKINFKFHIKYGDFGGDNFTQFIDVERIMHLEVLSLK
jgi:hypothetical protein